LVFFGEGIIIKADNGKLWKSKTMKDNNQCETELSILKKTHGTKYLKLFVPILYYGTTMYQKKKWTYTVSPFLQWSDKHPSKHDDVSLLMEAIDKLQLLDVNPFEKRNCAVTMHDRLYVYDYGMIK